MTTISNASPIVAIATPSGRGGVGVIRISGKDLTPLIKALFGKSMLQPRLANYLPFTDADGSIIDQGLAIYFKAPHSYTGEDVLELQGHGGPVVMQLLLSRCIAAGQSIDLRLAEPGEFTRRAFLNDKLDLAQAEAVADLIDASTKQRPNQRRVHCPACFQNRYTSWSHKLRICARWSKQRSISPRKRSTFSRKPMLINCWPTSIAR